jgi:hypothetical protein
MNMLRWYSWALTGHPRHPESPRMPVRKLVIRAACRALDSLTAPLPASTPPEVPAAYGQASHVLMSREDLA